MIIVVHVLQAIFYFLLSQWLLLLKRSVKTYENLINIDSLFFFFPLYLPCYKKYVSTKAEFRALNFVQWLFSYRALLLVSLSASTRNEALGCYFAVSSGHSYPVGLRARLACASCLRFLSAFLGCVTCLLFLSAI